MRQKFAGSERDGETGLDYMKARYYSPAAGRFTSVDPSRKSIIPTDPQTWNRYSYAYNNPLAFVDQNGKWPERTHNKIIATAFNGLNVGKLRQIQRGSASVDADFRNPRKLVAENTLVEAMAPRHAMTPGFKVRELGSESAARAWARNEASIFINDRMDKAHDLYRQSLDATTFLAKDSLRSRAYYAFGEGAHTVMDGSSPAHRDFQVYDRAQYDGGITNPAHSLVAFVTGMKEHGDEESSEPTGEEMTHMVDLMRLRFYRAFGAGAYNEAVSEDQRRQTAERLGKQGISF